MCTAISFHGNGHYFGRTLDHTCSYGEEVVLTPRNFPLPFRHVPELRCHHAILGMAHVAGGYPLYYDAMNEHGLCMAGLNFEGFACYGGNGRDRVAAFELIPWLLGQCANLREARELLKNLSITEESFSAEYPAARLHWLLADRTGALTIESLADGLRVWKNPVGVLTNAPPFDEQMRHLGTFLHLSPRQPHNHIYPECELPLHSLGMGAMGLPGDLSSPSRFVRAVFTKSHAENGGVEQFFHLLDTVRQTRGCCCTEEGELEFTRYSSCCDTENRRYCYVTDTNRRITAITMDRENLEGTALRRWTLLENEDILLQN